MLDVTDPSLFFVLSRISLRVSFPTKSFDSFMSVVPSIFSNRSISLPLYSQHWVRLLFWLFSNSLSLRDFLPPEFCNWKFCCTGHSSRSFFAALTFFLPGHFALQNFYLANFSQRWLVTDRTFCRNNVSHTQILASYPKAHSFSRYFNCFYSTYLWYFYPWYFSK